MSHRSRLYLITPPRIESIDPFLETLDDALGAGDVACLQLRLKSSDGVPEPDDVIRKVGEAICPVAHAHDVALVINDRPDLAAAIGADGVHIGQEDGSYKDARKWVGEDGIVGVTCHDSRHLAMVAGEAGADYVAFGAFYETSTKTPKSSADPEILSWWQEMMELPCVAIGGITVDNAEPLVRAGADFLAVSSGVWSHSDGAAEAVRAFNALFDRLRPDAESPQNAP